MENPILKKKLEVTSNIVKSVVNSTIEQASALQLLTNFDLQKGGVGSGRKRKFSSNKGEVHIETKNNRQHFVTHSTHPSYEKGDELNNVEELRSVGLKEHDNKQEPKIDDLKNYNKIKKSHCDDDVIEKDDTVNMSKKELKKEHKRLVNVLESDSHKDDKQEAKKQKKEMESMEKGIEIYTPESILKFAQDLRKAYDEGKATKEDLEKAAKDIRKLTKKTITNKAGKQQTVYVRANTKTSDEKDPQHGRKYLTPDEASKAHKERHMNAYENAYKKVISMKDDDSPEYEKARQEWIKAKENLIENLGNNPTTQKFISSVHNKKQDTKSSTISKLAEHPEFYDKVAEHIGLPDDDGESESALHARIAKHPNYKKFVNSFK